MKTQKYKYGLTLVEMLIVVAVIGLLATMLLGIASRIDTQSKEKALAGTFALLESALEQYREFKGDFPAANNSDPEVNSEILYGELDSIPESRQMLKEISASLIKNKAGGVDTLPEIYDLWGTVLDYRYNPAVDNFPALISAGLDRRFGTPDDITNR